MIVIIFLIISIQVQDNIFQSQTYVTYFEGSEKWHTVIVGAGFSGLTMAARLKEIGVSFTIIEKAEEVGGTWWYNIYPGAACDIPSHLYSISFFPNPNWTKSFSM